MKEHNGWVPRDFWLEEWEKQAIIGFHLKNPLEGYGRLTFMILDADIVAVSPSMCGECSARPDFLVEVEWEAVEEGHGVLLRGFHRAGERASEGVSLAILACHGNPAC